MKRSVTLLALCLTASAALLWPHEDAFARRLGGGGNAGLQRSLPARPAAPQSPPPQQAAPAATPQPSPANRANPQQAAPQQNAAAPGAAAVPPPAAPRRPWLAPLAGLAAGLGLAALASHFGFGEALANVVTLLLLLAVGAIALRFVLARLGRGRDLRYAAGATQPAAPEPPRAQTFPSAPTLPSSADRGLALATAPEAGRGGTHVLELPPGFDVAAFEKIAKLIFIRLQAANDAGDLQDLRRFTTPEMYAAARLDLQNRVPGIHQRTDVVQLSAEIVDVAQEDTRDVISVRYSGLLREENGGVAEPFDEIWHLVRPSGGSGGDWAIAGIQQAALA